MTEPEFTDPLAGLDTDGLNLEVKTCPVCASKYAGTPGVDVDELLRRDVALQDFIRTLEDAAARGSQIVDGKAATFVAKCLRNLYRHTQQ